jgi:hypothetical protein
LRDDDVSRDFNSVSRDVDLCLETAKFFGGKLVARIWREDKIG